MKKVGILTFHYSDNYGAVLQAYALRERINRIPGCICDIVNYIPEKYTYSLYQNNEEIRDSLIEKRELFEEFLKEYCGVEEPVISDLQETDYDVYVVGSDQVWNFDFADREYLLSSVKEDKIKVAYAASVGISAERAMDYKELFAQYLPSFRALSVREEEHVEFIGEMSEKKCCSVSDPTLLLRPCDYEKLMAKELLFDKPFLFFFWLRHDHDLMKGVEFANQLARKYDLNIIHSVAGARPYMFHKDGGCMIFEGVDAFLWYIKNAAFVVTNSYHATLFSVQMNTPFYAFPVKKMRSRMDMLSQKLGIGERIVEGYVSPSDMNDDIDFVKIEEKIETERRHSERFLIQALDVDGC